MKSFTTDEIYERAVALLKHSDNPEGIDAFKLSYMIECVTGIPKEEALHGIFRKQA